METSRKLMKVGGMATTVTINILIVENVGGSATPLFHSTLIAIDEDATSAICRYLD